MPEKFPSAQEESPFKIETIKTPDGNEVSFCPERGGIITSIKLKGKEILYLDKETFNNTGVNVKGGVPILFPNAGPIENPKFPDLKQHGFARTSKNWGVKTINSENQTGFAETLKSNENTRTIYPYDFQLSVQGQLEKDGSFTLLQQVESLESDKEIPVSMGLHPYFKVPHNQKKEIKFDFEGGDIIERDVENWSNGGTTSIDNPKIKNPDAIIKVKIPSLGTLTIDVSPEYRKIWIWSLPEKDFICIEPVMRDEGGLVEDPELIKPKTTFSGQVNFSLDQVG